jgi:hypothetical protein
LQDDPAPAGAGGTQPSKPSKPSVTRCDPPERKTPEQARLTRLSPAGAPFACGGIRSAVSIGVTSSCHGACPIVAGVIAPRGVAAGRAADAQARRGALNSAMRYGRKRDLGIVLPSAAVALLAVCAAMMVHRGPCWVAMRMRSVRWWDHRE